MWLKKRKFLNAFVASSLTIAAIIFFFALGLFPNMIVAKDPTYSLTIYNAASSEYTLQTMFILACIGLPFVLGYTTIIYWTYRGKTTSTSRVTRPFSLKFTFNPTEDQSGFLVALR